MAKLVTGTLALVGAIALLAKQRQFDDFWGPTMQFHSLHQVHVLGVLLLVVAGIMIVLYAGASKDRR